MYTGWFSTMVTTDGNVVGGNLMEPGTFIGLFPSGTGHLVYAPKTDALSQIIFVLAGNLTGFTTGAG
jgi:hypothetical protein